jgi:hypothetical protein
MNKQTKGTIERCYFELERLAYKHGASRYFDAAYHAALTGEKAHRRMGRGLGTYQCSVKLAAMYFVCKWASEPLKGAPSWHQASSLRPDYVQGCACAEQLREANQGNALTAIAIALGSIDYSRDIAGNKACSSG